MGSHAVYMQSGILLLRYTVVHDCMDVFPLCGIGMMVANTYEIKPLDFNPRFTFEQMYEMHIGKGKPSKILIHRLQYYTRVDAFLNVD